MYCTEQCTRTCTCVDLKHGLVNVKAISVTQILAMFTSGTQSRRQLSFKNFGFNC